jgi:hypothetical protein
MTLALDQALTTAEQSNEVRCIVITGAGRGFCAGGDLKAVQARAAASQTAALGPRVDDLRRSAQTVGRRRRQLVLDSYPGHGQSAAALPDVREVRCDCGARDRPGARGLARRRASFANDGNSRRNGGEDALGDALGQGSSGGGRIRNDRPAAIAGVDDTRAIGARSAEAAELMVTPRAGTQIAWQVNPARRPTPRHPRPRLLLTHRRGFRTSQ